MPDAPVDQTLTVDLKVINIETNLSVVSKKLPFGINIKSSYMLHGYDK